MKTTQTDARKRIEKAIDLLDEIDTLLGDSDDLERALAGVTSGMVESPGHAKEGTFRAFEARQLLRAALKGMPSDPEEGCRCPVCGGRNDDPAGIHGRR